MNLNDMRNSAYQNMMGAGKPVQPSENKSSAEKSVSKPVFPRVSTEKNSGFSKQPAPSSEPASSANPVLAGGFFTQ